MAAAIANRRGRWSDILSLGWRIFGVLDDIGADP
jgi:hypothetical protein